MNILTRIKAALFPKVVAASLPSGVLEFMTRYGKVPDVNQEALVRKYWGWTYSCVNVTATRLASTPLKLYASRGKGESKVGNFSAKAVGKEKTQWLRSRIGKSIDHVAGAEDFEELEEHPLLDLLQNVNDQENGFEMKELTSTMLDLTGNAYWMLEKDKLSVPSKLFVLRSQWVRIIPDRDKFVSGYWYGYNNMFGSDQRLELPPDAVIHFKYPNPLDPWYGMGPVQAAAYSIESAELREKFTLATMSNMARPDLIVKYLEGELDPTQRAQVEREWNATFRGAKNAGKIKVTDFRYEIDKVGWNPSELDFNRGEDWILKKICAAFPVPLGLIDSSYISRAPRSGMEGSDLFMAQFNTLPRCTRIEEKLNEQLCPMYDERLFVAFDNPVPKDRVLQNSEDAQRLNTFQVTINEIRKRNGEDPVEWGDVPLAPMGIAPLGSAQTMPAEAGAASTATQPDKGARANSPLAQASGSPGGASVNKPPEEGAEEATLAERVEAAKKAMGDGLAMEVEGAYVHPTLAGMPIKLRVRNETGRFDRHDPDRVRARDRATVDALTGRGNKRRKLVETT
jgi:HK97 family phage portal protein